MNTNKNMMPALLDREIATNGEDAFGHTHYAGSIESYIEDAGKKPPFSIGLLGKWGTGKSSIKELYLTGLRDDEGKDTHGLRRKDKVFPITFNAWRYGGENIKRALLRHVFIMLDGDEGQIVDKLFNQVQRPTNEPKGLRIILWELYDKWLWTALQLLAANACTILLIRIISHIFNLTENLSIAAVVGACALFNASALKYISEAKQFTVSRYAAITRVELPSISAEQYEKVLTDQLSKFKKGKASPRLARQGKETERIVIFVDDLDRLSAEEMISGLDAIRTFMEIPSPPLPPGLGIVFVISCDEDRIADALANRRKQTGASDLPGAVFSRNDARRYLDRIFQFRLEIPPTPKQDMRSFVLKRLLTEAPEVAQDMKTCGVSPEEVVSRMIHVRVQSPRNALQILNAFLQSWWVACQRERDGAGTDRPGGLQEGAVTKHPVALAALCVLKVDFPDFYDDLLLEPQLISRFSNVFIHNGPMASQPEMTRDILQKYMEASRPDDVPGELPSQIRTAYKPLRQFIASLGGIRWPSTLQPLLLMSQDPVTRKLGDKAYGVREALVSGDAHGVLSNLGRDLDAKSLSPAEVDLLHGLFEDLEQETADRRNNAYAALSGILNRLPTDEAHLLLVPLAHFLSQSPELRWRLGVPNIKAILDHASEEDRKAVAGELISEVLRKDGDIDFRLETGEVPSLDEAVEIVRATAGLVLEVRSRTPLDSKRDRNLMDWLLLRHVSSGGKSQALPFSDMEAWMGSHEDELLNALNSRYTDALVTELQSKNPPDLNPEVVVRRSRKVFEDLQVSGEDSRTILWELLARYVSVQMRAVPALAWEFLSLHTAAPSSEAFSQFITNFAVRLDRDMLAGEEWALDWEAGGKALLLLVGMRRTDIGKPAQQALGKLAVSWSGNKATGGLATSLLDDLVALDKAQAAPIINDWTPRILTDLPDTCIEWIGRHFGDTLEPAQQSAIVAYLAPLAQRVAVTAEEGRRYAYFLENVPGSSMAVEPMASQLTNTYVFMSQQWSTEQYVKNVFPAIAHTIGRGPGSQTGQMLHTLFANTRNAPAMHGFLHRQMTGRWPQESASLPSYDPTAIFTWAKSVADSNPNQEQAAPILVSMLSMLTCGAVEADVEDDLLETALLLWPWHEAQAFNTFEAISAVPDLEQAAGIMASVDPADSESVGRLQKAWSFFAPRLSPTLRIEGAREILTSPARGTIGKPDLFFALWLEVNASERADIIRTLVLDQSLNDEQRKRTWLQAEAFAGTLGQEYFVRILPEVLSAPASPDTVQAALVSRDDITTLFSTAESKNVLAKILLQAFLSATSRNTKERLMAWVKSLGNDAILKELATMGVPSADDVSILSTYFPKSRYLRKYLKQEDVR